MNFVRPCGKEKRDEEEEEEVEEEEVEEVEEEISVCLPLFFTNFVSWPA